MSDKLRCQECNKKLTCKHCGEILCQQTLDADSLEMGCKVEGHYSFDNSAFCCDCWETTSPQYLNPKKEAAPLTV
jgi:hypothetical protein